MDAFDVGEHVRLAQDLVGIDAQWFRRKHKVRSGGYVRFPDDRLRNDCGLTRLGTRRRYLAGAKA